MIVPSLCCYFMTTLRATVGIIRIPRWPFSMRICSQELNRAKVSPAMLSKNLPDFRSGR